jgi:hypothetical protein
MSRPANVTMRPDVQARARAIIARVLSRPVNCDTSEWSEDAPTVKPKTWNHAENYRARQKAFRAYAKQDVAKTHRRP